MDNRLIPEIGQWYLNRETGDLFEIVAHDHRDGYLEIQYFGGEIEEIDADNWDDLVLMPISEPDDPTGPYELTKEDYFYDNEYSTPENWSGPLSGLEPITLYELEDWY